MKKLFLVIILIIALLVPIANAGESVDSRDGELFRGILDVGLGVWGITQDTSFGYVAGGLLLLRGTIILVRF